MTNREVLQAIAEVGRAHLGWSQELTPELRLVEDLQLDSVRLLTLAIEVENRFQICLDEDDEFGIETVSDLVAAVQRGLGTEQDSTVEAGTVQADPAQDG